MSTQAASTQAASTRWEYKVWAPSVRARLSDERLQKDLNELGAQGWEMCGTEGDAKILKRPRG